MKKDDLDALKDPSNWELAPEQPQRSGVTRAVVSVAFPRDDFEALARYSRTNGLTVSQVIRSATTALTRGAGIQPRLFDVSIDSHGPAVRFTGDATPASSTDSTTKIIRLKISGTSAA